MVSTSTVPLLPGVKLYQTLLESDCPEQEWTGSDPAVVAVVVSSVSVNGKSSWLVKADARLFLHPVDGVDGVDSVDGVDNVDTINLET